MDNLNLIAYKMQGHWAFNHALIEPEKRDYEEKQMELWFIFYDNRPSPKNNLSLDEKIRLPDLLLVEDDNYRPEIQQALDDMKEDSKWKEIVLMALDLYDIRNDYMKTGLKSINEGKQPIIAQWSPHGNEKSKSGYDWPRIIDKDSKFYKNVVVTFGKSNMFILKNGVNPSELSEYAECFAVEKVLEKREAIVDGCMYKLKSGDETIKTGDVSEDIEKVKNQALKDELKVFAKTIRKWT